MQKAIDAITALTNGNGFEKCTFSSPRAKSDDVRSVVVRKMTDKAQVNVEYRLKKHNDIRTIKKSVFLGEDLAGLLEQFKQGQLSTQTESVQILMSRPKTDEKSGISRIKSKIIRRKIVAASVSAKKQKHNKDKRYLIPDGTPCAFLVAIGVMDRQGKVKHSRYKKFRQINRFLELVDDLYRNDDLKDFHAVDFGCGKSYLTLALYHYFSAIRSVDVRITGIDLKQEVIDHCNGIAAELGFSGLKFVHGFIHEFKADHNVDFVVTLHACDTATDDAILFSLRNRARRMMFVPCCQHELNGQLSNAGSSILLKHGILRDRMTALVTDTMRSQLLEACGYKVQTMEFIGLEHTAKNIMLRCSKVNRSKKQIANILEKYVAFKKQWSINPYLEESMVKESFICHLK